MEAFKKHIGYRLGELKKHIHLVRDRGEVEDIHDLRLDIKKLRSVIQLIRLTIPLNGPNSFRYFRSLFKTAGNVRELQVNRKLLSEWDFKELKQVKKRLKKREKSVHLKLDEVMESYGDHMHRNLVSELDAIVRRLDRGELLRAADRFFSDSLDIITELSVAPSTEELHDIRIRLKSASEVLMVLSEIGFEEELKSLKTRIKPVTAALGDWHDLALFSEWLEGYRKKESRSSIRRALKVVQADVESREASARLTIKQELHTILDENLELGLSGGD